MNAHTNHMIRAHDDVPGDLNEPEFIVPESCDQIVTDDSSNPLDIISQSHVNSSEREDPVVFPIVERSSQKS